MTKKVPISDSGMAIIGIKTALKLPKNKKITTVTMSKASTSVWMTSVIEVVINLVES